MEGAAELEEEADDHHEGCFGSAGETPNRRLVARREQAGVRVRPLERAQDGLGVAVELGAPSWNIGARR